jgi:uncharacterized repeat protein (TIGR01451 family)
MKSNWLLKLFSPFLGLSLVVGLLLFLGSSSAGAQDVPPTPTVDIEPQQELDPYPAISPLVFTAMPEAPAEPVQVDVSLPNTDPTNSLSWGDYDNDGDLDLLVGNGAGKPNRLYQNTGGTLTEIWSFVCEGDPSADVEDTRSIAWMDGNMDGYLDFMVGNNNGRNCFYTNQLGLGGTGFLRTWLASATEATTAIAPAGWENDGSFAMYVAVGDAVDSVTYYRVDEYGTLLYQPSLPDAATSLAWGDYDNDGDPDLALGVFGGQTIIYRNNGNELVRAYTFSDIQGTNDIAWGDIDGDGDLDLAFANGSQRATEPARVYCNSNNGAIFTNCWESGTVSVSRKVSWGDYDGDGLLDLAVAGDTAYTTRVYINEGSTPPYLNTTSFWNANDTDLRANDITWADLQGDGDLELAIGYTNSPIQIYDNVANNFKRLNFEDLANIVDTRSVAWGDYNADGWLDLAVGQSNGAMNQVYRNNGNNTFSTVFTAGFARNTRSVAWGDFNNDGYIDLAVGNGQTGSGQANQIYRNINGTLSLYGGFYDGSYFASQDTYAIAWGDYDGDGDLDLAEGAYGQANNPQSNRIMINRNGIFTEAVSIDYPLVPKNDPTWAIAWADFDQDYDLDLAVGNDTLPSRVYVNDGKGKFTALNLPTVPAADAPCLNRVRTLDWADWDGDGDVDLALGGDGCVRVLSASKTGEVWSFTEAWRLTETGLSVFGLAWGDYDGDKDPDLALGLMGQFGASNRIYRNTGGSFSRYWTAPDADKDPTMAVAWGDMDRDGDLDLAVANGNAPRDQADRVYINNWHTNINLPNDPVRAVIERPDWYYQDEADFFSSSYLDGRYQIPVSYDLIDDESDPAFRVQHLVSWDGGYKWEPAWSCMGSQGGTWVDVPTNLTYTFCWDVLNQLLAHQNIPFNPGGGVYVPFGKSIDEIDVMFRVVPWSQPYHGGYIQRPTFGTDTTLFRVDMRPDWADSAKIFRLGTPVAVHPGDTLDLSVVITQTDHGMPPKAYMIDYLPAELYMDKNSSTAWRSGYSSMYPSTLDWDSKIITWTGALEYYYWPSSLHKYYINFTPKVVRPLPNGTDVTNCAHIYDGLHAPFERCLTFEISSTPKTDDSWKLVNGLTVNTVLPGDLLTYTIVLTNTGTDNAHNVVMTDVVPAHTIWLSKLASSRGQINYTYDISQTSGIINWRGELNVFQPVYITYTVRVEKPLAGNTVITNTFFLQDNINPVWKAPQVTTYVNSVDLRKSTKEDLPNLVSLNDPVIYTIILRNTGGLAATPAYLTDPIPAGSSYISSTLQVNPTGTATYGYDANRKRIYWFGNLAPSQMVTITYGILAGVPNGSTNGIITNTATVTDTWGGMVTLVATTTVELPNLNGSVKIASPGTVEMGDHITYTVSISNTAGYAPNVVATDAIPAGSVFVPNSIQTSGGSVGYDAAKKQVTWQSPVNTQQQLGFTYVITAGCPNNLATGVISNVVYIQDPTGYVISRTATTTVQLPDLDTSTIQMDKLIAVPGDVVRYTITLRNTGVDGNLWMEDKLPVEFDWVAQVATTGNITYNPSTRIIRWDGFVGTGEQVIITIDVRVRKNMINNQIANNVVISDGCYTSPLQPGILSVKYLVFLPMILR